MKKFLILAATVALSAACSQTYEVNPVSKDGGVIGFGSWAENLTRANNAPHLAGTTSFESGDTFAVFGRKDRASGDPTTSAVFTGDVVSFDGSNWTYSPARFWDVNYDSYTFYAVSPAKISDALTANIATADGTVAASTSISFDGKTNDILVADEKTVAKGGSPYFANYATVPLVFNHVATLFDLKVKKHSNLADAKVYVKSISLTNMDNTGTFGVTGYTSTHPIVEWTPTAHTGAYNHESGVTSVTLPTSTNKAAGIGTDGTDYLIHDLIAMPQTIRGGGENIQTVTISYEIKVGEEAAVEHNNVTFILKSFDQSDDTDNTSGSFISTWLPGKHYIYTITIDAKAITFSASITDWAAAVNGYHYLMD